MKKIVLIPAYDPDDKLISTIKEIRDQNSEIDIIVINDGSKTECDDIFTKAKEFALVISHEQNKGKGAALKTGFRYIKENYEKPFFIVTADADGQHKTSDIFMVLDTAVENPDSLVLGSRKLGKDVPFRSRSGNAITRIIFAINTGKKVYDTQTGLRAFSDRLIDYALEVSGDRYEYEINFLMGCVRNKTEIIEKWIEVVYIEGNKSSHFNIVKDSFRIYKEIFKFSCSSFISFIIDYVLYCTFLFILGTIGVPEHIIFANIAARIISSIINFTINRKVVFKSKAPLFKSAVKYFLLAVFILAMNTLILKGFSLIGLNEYIAKIITEVILFIVSYLVQHFVIFKR